MHASSSFYSFLSSFQTTFDIKTLLLQEKKKWVLRTVRQALFCTLFQNMVGSGQAAKISKTVKFKDS